jgi:hypothetical protein
VNQENSQLGIKYYKSGLKLLLEKAERVFVHKYLGFTQRTQRGSDRSGIL